jgi:3-oxoacyl-[acyl-carrier-protein] synthase-3
MTSKEYGIGIIGNGHYIPSNIVTNEMIEAWSGVPAGEIVKRIGVKTRYVVDEDESASSMSVKSALSALGKSGISPDLIDLIIVCSFTGDYVFPAMACKVQELIGAKNAGAFDVMANCTGFQVGLTVASDRMKADSSIKHTLVIGTALQSRYINWQDPHSSIYFGDGSGAVVLGQVPKGQGILSTEIMTNGRVYDAVRMRGGGSSFPITKENVSDGLQFYELNGLEIWKQVVQFQPKAIQRSLEKIGKTESDVDFFIFHQANLRLIEFLMGKMRLPMLKTFTNVERIGNTADASMAIALSEALDLKLIKSGDLVVITGVGAGFTFGSTVIRWQQGSEGI